MPSVHQICQSKFIQVLITLMALFTAQVIGSKMSVPKTKLPWRMLAACKLPFATEAYASHANGHEWRSSSILNSLIKTLFKNTSLFTTAIMVCGLALFVLISTYYCFHGKQFLLVSCREQSELHACHLFKMTPYVNRKHFFDLPCKRASAKCLVKSHLKSFLTWWINCNCLKRWQWMVLWRIPNYRRATFHSKFFMLLLVKLWGC